MDVNLGDKVRDKITGLKGIAVARTEFINGCVQYLVQPKINKDGTIPQDVGIDSQSIEVIKPKVKKIKREETGGPMTRGMCRRNY
jgi:hypothetical protein